MIHQIQKSYISIYRNLDGDILLLLVSLSWSDCFEIRG